MIVQNLSFNDLYNVEVPKFTFWVKWRACVQLPDMICIIPKSLYVKRTSFNPKMKIWYFTELELFGVNILRHHV